MPFSSPWAYASVSTRPLARSSSTPLRKEVWTTSCLAMPRHQGMRYFERFGVSVCAPQGVEAPQHEPGILGRVAFAAVDPIDTRRADVPVVPRVELEVGHLASSRPALERPCWRKREGE